MADVYLFRRRTRSGELPLKAPDLSNAIGQHGGSVRNAMDPDVVQAAGESNPMRRMITQQCTRCAFEWTAPAVGNCPRCHRPGRVLSSFVCMAQRLK